MEYKTVIDHRKNALFTELQEARAKMLAAIRDARVKRQRVNEIHAQLAELHRIETIKSQSDEEEADSIDSETGWACFLGNLANPGTMPSARSRAVSTRRGVAASEKIHDLGNTLQHEETR